MPRPEPTIDLIEQAVYVHLDCRMLRHVPLAMEEAVGPERFLKQTVWKRTSAHSSANRHGPVHDALLYFSKSDSPVWNQAFDPYDKRYVDGFDTHTDPAGERGVMQ